MIKGYMFIHPETEELRVIYGGDPTTIMSDFKEIKINNEHLGIEGNIFDLYLTPDIAYSKEQRYLVNGYESIFCDIQIKTPDGKYNYYDANLRRIELKKYWELDFQFQFSCIPEKGLEKSKDNCYGNDIDKSMIKIVKDYHEMSSFILSGFGHDRISTQHYISMEGMEIQFLADNIALIMHLFKSYENIDISHKPFDWIKNYITLTITEHGIYDAVKGIKEQFKAMGMDAIEVKEVGEHIQVKFKNNPELLNKPYTMINKFVSILDSIGENDE